MSLSVRPFRGLRGAVFPLLPLLNQVCCAFGTCLLPCYLFATFLGRQKRAESLGSTELVTLLPLLARAWGRLVFSGYQLWEAELRPLHSQLCAM